jgi:hypothetical protein
MQTPASADAPPRAPRKRLCLIDDAGWVARRAWSVRFNVAGAVFGGVSAFVGFLLLRDVPFPIGPITLSIIGGASTTLSSVCALAARFVKQDRGHGSVDNE